MLLKDMLERLDYIVLNGSVDIEVNNLVMDSRKAEQGDVFVCITGAVRDSHEFASDVIEKGVSALVVEKDIKCLENIMLKNITLIKVKSTRYALACMSAAYFGYPAEKLKTIGITGTKGKTTAAYMIHSVLESVGIKTGLIGTIETVIEDIKIPSENTTPESFLVQKYFAQMVEKGCEAVVMEVSSQGLMLDRVVGFMFDYGIFTNLSPDHIAPGEHKDFEDYLSCKAKLFKNCRHGIFNIDDEYADRMIEGCVCDVETYGVGTENHADMQAKHIHLFTKPGLLGVSYDLSGKLEMQVEIHVPGEFSVYNSLAAIAVCRHFTEDKKKIEKALLDIKVKGRVELLSVSPKFTLMIDYAHNAMSLESLLTNLRKYKPHRIVTLFGCGGNRDKHRRYEMGEVSSRLSDLSVITSDNPRNEQPMAIIEDILTGVKRANGAYVTIPDRKQAIKYAIEHGEDGDIIVLAGKGHEDYQIIKGVKYHMDERELVEEVKTELGLV